MFAAGLTGPPGLMKKEKVEIFNVKHQGLVFNKRLKNGD